MKEARLFSSVWNPVRWQVRYASMIPQHTFLHLMPLPRRRLERRHRRGIDNLRQRVGLKVLFPRLLIRVMLPGVLLDRFQPVLFLPIMIHIGIEELACLLANIEHV
jgi:hypothetical protein